MVPEKYRLAAIGRHLIESWERRRPAIQAWDAATEKQLRAEADAELQKMQQQVFELEMDDPGHWKMVADAVDKIVIPRYVALAREENGRAADDYGMWRGGDIVARGTFALAGLILGAAVVAIPWIPIYEKWVPWALLVGGPFIPDAYFWWYRRRYRKKLEALLGELAVADQSFEKYRPLSEVQRTLTGAEAPASSDETQPVPSGRTRGRE